MLRQTFYLGCLLLLGLWVTPKVTGQKLSAPEQKKLQAGEILLQEKEVPDSSWPARTVQMLLDCTPLEAMAVFAAYEEQKHYVPKLIKSQVIAQKHARHSLVDYEMKTPWPLENVIYQNEHELQKRGEQYLLYWKQQRSNSTERNQGSVLFQKAPFSPEKTLMVYDSLIDPKSFFASWVEGRSREDLLKTLRAIKEYTETLKQTKPQKLQKLISLIERALQGEKVYRP